MSFGQKWWWHYMPGWWWKRRIAHELVAVVDLLADLNQSNIDEMLKRHGFYHYALRRRHRAP